MGSRVLNTYVTVGEETFAPGPVPHDVADLIDNPNVWVDDEDESSYGSASVKELHAEIEDRNADRDDDAQIKPEGTKKADLIAALEADDQAQA